VRLERALCLDDGDDRVARGEGEEERVALRVDLVSAVVSERCTDDRLVLIEDVPVAVAQPLDVRRRALDVREDDVTVPLGSSATENAYALRTTLSTSASQGVLRRRLRVRAPASSGLYGADDANVSEACAAAQLPDRSW